MYCMVSGLTFLSIERPEVEKDFEVDFVPGKYVS